VSACPCLEGCPACVGPAAESTGIKDKTRLLAAHLIR
jgi:hypothetical protein